MQSNFGFQKRSNRYRIGGGGAQRGVSNINSIQTIYNYLGLGGQGPPGPPGSYATVFSPISVRSSIVFDHFSVQFEVLKGVCPPIS